MVELSWSQTPNSLWWALENSVTTTSLDDLLNSPTGTPQRRADSLRKATATTSPTIFYNYADETDFAESEADLTQWVKEHHNRGIIRVFQPGSSYSELIKCTIDTTAETIMTRCFSKELFVEFGGKMTRRVGMTEHPLQLLYSFLQDIGHTNPQVMQVEGMKEDLAPLFKFITGYDNGMKPENNVQLAYALKVKEVNGLTVPVWNKRFCVLCGSRMFVFAHSQPRGKPNLVLDLQGGLIEEYKSKKHFYCVKITASRREVLLAFDTRLEQSRWLERAGKVISRHPLEANLAGYSLEKLPKYYFLNYNLVAVNLAHNFMTESFELTDAAMLGQPRSIGWIQDLSIFRHLVSLSLSDNCLDQFPLSLCAIGTLQELDISCNRLRSVPSEIKYLKNLTTLLLHSNLLTQLPYSLNELQKLSTLVIAFNRFFELPHIVKELPALAILVASGNYISALPEDLHRIQTLQHFDVRLNKIKTGLPEMMESLPKLIRVNVRGNGIPEIDMGCLPCVELFNCSDNSLRSLSINEGPIKVLSAKNNNITQFSVAPNCEMLTSIDVSRNELTSLPEPIAQLPCLEKLNVSHNKLTKLPVGIFTMEKLSTLQVFDNRLVSLPQHVNNQCGLQKLDFSRNQLSSLPSNLLTNMKRLEVLNLSTNRLTSLPPLVSGVAQEIPQLAELYAANNSLKESALTVITGYRKLKVLHLAFNMLRGIPSGFFTHMRELEYVNLSGNFLSSLPPILGCPQLQFLLLHSNQLPSLPSLPSLPRLKTLDLSCNQFEAVPDLSSFSHLQYLDLSGNGSLSISKEKAKNLKNWVPNCCLEGVLDINTDLRSKMTHLEIGGTSIHGKWSYGSARLTGVENSQNSVLQVKVSSLNSRKKDGLFAILDGGRTADAPKVVKKILEETLVEELVSCERDLQEGYQNPDHLLYLNHTFLSAHRQLGDVGRKYGCSAVVCHIQALKNGAYLLNVANTGLGEAILCRSGRAVPLTTPHSPSTNLKERARIADAKGFISQDSRVNGACAVSRLIGCYHLWPQVIPSPSTESVELRDDDEYIVIGTDGLWKNLTYEQIVHEVRSISDPIQASKRLRDLAVAQGCNSDISVIVVKLKIDRIPHPRSVLKPQPLKVIPEPQVEEEDEDVKVTNIDDDLTEEEEEEEEGQVEESEELDKLVLSAIKSPLADSSQPTMESTNFDDFPFTDDSPSAVDSALSGLSGQATLQAEVPPSYRYMPPPPISEDDYVAQTLPKDASKSRKNSGKGVKVNSGFAILPETSFEQTQSVPTLMMNGSLSHDNIHGDQSDHKVNSQLAALNEAFSRLEEEGGTGTGYYNAESIERPRRKGGKIVKRLSYVERSYKKLTNETYSSGSLGPTKNTTNLVEYSHQ